MYRLTWWEKAVQAWCEPVRCILLFVVKLRLILLDWQYEATCLNKLFLVISKMTTYNAIFFQCHPKWAQDSKISHAASNHMLKRLVFVIGFCIQAEATVGKLRLATSISHWESSLSYCITSHFLRPHNTLFLSKCSRLQNAIDDSTVILCSMNTQNWFCIDKIKWKF